MKQAPEVRQARILSIANEKGGAGKTTTAMSLASVLADTGSRVLVVDVDPQGSSAWWAERAGEGLPFDFASESDPGVLGLLRGAPYDVVIVDTPGSLTGRDVLETVVGQSDFVLLPTEPAALALTPVVRTVTQIVRPSGVEHRAVLNSVDPRAPQEADDARAMLEGSGIGVLAATVRSYAAHKRAPLEGVVATQYPLTSRYARNAVDDYRRVGMELLGLWSRTATTK